MAEVNSVGHNIGATAEEIGEPQKGVNPTGSLTDLDQSSQYYKPEVMTTMSSAFGTILDTEVIHYAP